MRAEEVGLRAGPTQEGYGGRGRHDRKTGGSGTPALRSVRVPFGLHGPELRVDRWRVARKTGGSGTRQHSCYARQVRGWRGGWVLRACGFRRQAQGRPIRNRNGGLCAGGLGGGGRGWLDDLEVAPAILGPRLHAAWAARPCSRWRGRERRQGRIPGCAPPGPPGLVPDGGDVSGGRGGSQAARRLGRQALFPMEGK